MINSRYQELKKISFEHTLSQLFNSNEFESLLHVAKEMLLQEEWDEELQEYAVTILEELRRVFPEKWNSNWKYDAFLGYAYHIILKYDERYEAYKRAFEQVKSPPPQLLIAMANCFFCPGKPPITIEEAISFAIKAIQTTNYSEGIELLIALYKFVGNSKETRYWESVLIELDGKIVHLPSLDRIESGS